MAEPARTTARTTVVIATRNRCPELLRTLYELTAQAPPVPVIVVDNASTDGTATEVGLRFPRCTVLRARRNLGAAARNLGVRAAATPYVAFADDDSWWEPGALALAEQAFDRHPRLGLVAGRTLVGPANRPDPVTSLLAESPLGHDGGLPGPAVLGFLACSAIVRREAFRAVGGFSSLLFFAGEERLLAWDLAAAGWQCCYLADVVAHHHPSTDRPPSRWRLRQQRRNDVLTAWLRRPPRAALAATAELARAAARDTDARQALRAALARLPSALASRRPLPLAVERQVALLEQDR